MLDAADAIERLEAENQRLETAIRNARDPRSDTPESWLERICETLDDALGISDE
jgi:hypothetical protein